MRHIFFSDLDGTLLDHDTYRYDMAMDGLAMIKKRRAMLVLVSSKTLAEMKQIYEKLAL
ncbi:MAG: mannosyl-3-phosphoglycerate phosphatase, partial [Chrysiogenales bacterium]